MEDLIKKSIFAIVVVVTAGCGVKGRPLPPKNPPPLGRGEPTYKETQKKKSTNNPAVGAEEGSGR